MTKNSRQKLFILGIKSALMWSKKNFSSFLEGDDLGLLTRVYNIFDQNSEKIWKHSRELQNSGIALLVTLEYAKTRHLKCWF